MRSRGNLTPDLTGLTFISPFQSVPHELNAITRRVSYCGNPQSPMMHPINNAARINSLRFEPCWVRSWVLDCPGSSLFSVALFANCRHEHHDPDCQEQSIWPLFPGLSYHGDQGMRMYFSRSKVNVNQRMPLPSVGSGRPTCPCGGSIATTTEYSRAPWILVVRFLRGR